MTDHKPMPVSGYTPQSQAGVDLANEGKEAEERYLRWLDKVEADPNSDPVFVERARMNIQQGAMWAVRSIFKPQRIKLPGE